MQRSNSIKWVVLGLVVIAGLLVHGGEALGAVADGIALNRSVATTCAEEDNVNVPIWGWGRPINRHVIVATHPRYPIGTDSCAADWSGCTRRATPSSQPSLCSTAWDDGTNVVEVCTVSDWWRPDTMEVLVNGQSWRAHYLRLYRKLADAASWPQFLVLYQDGNLRLKPHPPQGRPDVCFGSSVIVGPAKPAARPYVDVMQASIDTFTLSMDLIYQQGGSTHIDLNVDRAAARATVQANYGLKLPFVTFRSMFVADGNSDVDHVAARSNTVPIRIPIPILSGWKWLPGSSWFFYRQTRSQHNTSAPDIAVTVTDWIGRKQP